MNEAMSKAVDGFMRSKQRDAIVACVLFGLGWQFSPFMALCAAVLYFKLMKRKRREGQVSRGAIIPHSQKEYVPMQNNVTSNKMELKDWLLIAGVALYVIFPLDFDFIPGLGWIDDAALVGWAIKHFNTKFSKKDVPPSEPAKRSRALSVRRETRFDDDPIDVEVVERPRRRRRA